MELPIDYVSPLLPVMGIINCSTETEPSLKLISKITAGSFIDIVKLSTVIYIF